MSYRTGNPYLIIIYVLLTWTAGVQLRDAVYTQFSKSDPRLPSSFSNTLCSYLLAMRENFVKYIYSICRYEYMIHSNVFIWALSS
jgi:hypothetical protein